MKALVEPGRSVQGSLSALEGQGEPLILQLTHGLSHESRNSLNALAIHLEVLGDKLRDAEGAIPPHLDKNLQASRAQVRRLSETLSRFSEFVAMRQEQGDLRECLEVAARLCSYQLRRADISLHPDIPDGIRVDVDPPLLQRLLVQAILAVTAALPPCEIWLVSSTSGDEVQLLLQGSETRAVEAGEHLAQREGSPAQALGIVACGCGGHGASKEISAGPHRPLSFTARLVGALDPLRATLETVGGELRTKTSETEGCMIALPLWEMGL